LITRDDASRVVKDVAARWFDSQVVSGGCLARRSPRIRIVGIIDIALRRLARLPPAIVPTAHLAAMQMPVGIARKLVNAKCNRGDQQNADCRIHNEIGQGKSSKTST
jgi:hypothetical protein